MPTRPVTRRSFLAGSVAAASAALLAACAGTAATAPKGAQESSATDTIAALANGSGALVELDGELVAVYKDDSGAVTKLSPKCPHAGCDVEWNEADGVWDCPCHRSQFAADGSVLAGPAKAGLEKIG